MEKKISRTLALISKMRYHQFMININIINAIVSEMNNCFKENKNSFSETRDIFSARMQSYILETKKYLEAAIIGEIGNNTFDHNFIFEDNCLRGVYCDLSYNQKHVILADFGKGIKQSLLPVVPSISSDLEALNIAFTKQISGRSPEQRGNGLKFVSESITQNNWYLFFQSGFASCSIDINGIIFNEMANSIKGCLAVLDLNAGN